MDGQLFVGIDGHGSNVQRLWQLQPVQIRPTPRRRPSGLGLLALVCHVKTAAAERRRQSSACDICIFRPPAPAATGLAWLVSRVGASQAGDASLSRRRLWFTVYPHRPRDRREDDTHASCEWVTTARQTCYSLRARIIGR